MNAWKLKPFSVSWKAVLCCETTNNHLELEKNINIRNYQQESLATTLGGDDELSSSFAIPRWCSGLTITARIATLVYFYVERTELDCSSRGP